MKDKPTDILLEGIAGSTAFGLATADSDIDVHGIYRAPLREVLGLNVGQVVDHTWTHTNPDIALHEVGKFINLGLKCNPTVLETLWLDSYIKLTASGRLLISRRNDFLFDKGVRGAYGGYASAQVHKLKTGTRPTAKMGRHAFRILMMGEQLISTATMRVNVSEHRDFLFDMGRLAETDVDKFLIEFELKLEKFEDAKSVLPERPNRELFQKLLPKIRLVAT